MSGIKAEPIASIRVMADRQVEGYTPQWLTLLSWELLFVDGEVDRYRAHVPGCARRWLITRASAGLLERGLRRIEHEYLLAPLLEPDWSVPPVAVLHTPEGPLLICDDPGGQSLDQVADGALSIDAFLRLAIGAAHALARAHGKGLVHCDIKPCSLIQGPDGKVRLTGFGVSPATGEGPGADSICATLAYMAPEQARRVGRQADERSDLYALGMTFYEWLTGRLPFEAGDAVEWVYCHVARQPPSPQQFRSSIPAPLARVILDLIAKNPADRYQSASRLEADLRECLAQWSEFQHIATFEPACRDVSARGAESSALFLRPEENQALRAAFARVAQSGQCELVLLSGEAGVGKSTLVRQLHQDLALSQVVFASGKFDPDSPYASLAQALRSLVMRVLGESAAELDRWREKLAVAVGEHGRLIANLVPEIELVLGPQNAAPDLPTSETRHFFDYVLHRLLNCFASAQRPLLLFFDDVQWRDDAVLSFLTSFSAGHSRHILLIAAYREGQEADGMPFQGFLQGLRQASIGLNEIRVSALAPEAVVQWVGHLLHAEPETVRPLAALVHEKTGGNPFFVAQLIRTLLDDELIGVGPATGVLEWNLEHIRQHPHADNVIGLMVSRIARLPAQTRLFLGLMACMGASVDSQTLGRVTEVAHKTLCRHLAPAVDAGLLVEDHQGFAFYHDRVQEAAYQLIPLDARPGEHRRIARLLMVDIDPQGRCEPTFRIASHLQRIRPADSSPAERLQFCAVLVRAAQQALESAAIEAALAYVVTATGMLDEALWASRWEQCPALAHDLGVVHGQCLLLDGQFELAGQVIDALFDHVIELIPRSALYMLKVEVLVLACRYHEAVATAGAGLRQFGIHIPTQVTSLDVEQSYRYLLEVLGPRDIASLDALPDMHDSSFEAAMGLLSSMIASASFIDDDLLFVLTCEMVQLSLEYGICAASTHGLAWFGVALAHKFGAYSEGVAYASVARRLVRARGYRSSESTTLVALDQVCVWTQPLSHGLEHSRQALASSYSVGNLTMSCYACNHIVSNLLVMGEHLDRVEQEIERALAFARRARFDDVQLALQTQARLVRALRLGRIWQSDAPSPEHQALEDQARNSAMTPVAFWWRLFKGIARFLYRDFDSAGQCFEQALELAWSTPAHIHLLDLHFFTALNLAAQCRQGDDVTQTLARMTPHLQQLDAWAALNPQTFKDKALLARAEAARLRGDAMAAMGLYEAAITVAANAGFVHVQALAHELAGEFHHAQGLFTSARSHYRNARDCYQRWGALGKVADLEARGGILRGEASMSRPSISFLASQDALDLVSVMKASQALSEEIVLDRLIATLLTNTIIHAGAQQAVLLLVKDDIPHISAKGTAQQNGIDIDLTVLSPSAQQLPLSMLYTVMRTRQLVVIEDAQHLQAFTEDEYFRGREVRSVLCLPLVKQGAVIGVLYLENNLAPGVFTSNRTTVLELLAGQAAISLETARLYAELVEENTRRREIEAALLTSQATLALGQRISNSGSFRWQPSTGDAVWTDDLFAVWGVPVTEVPPSLEALIPLIHPEDLQGFLAKLNQAVRTSSVFQIAFRLMSSERQIRHIELLGEPAGADVFVGVATDVTERKATEAALRKARTELSKVSQATIMGELAASIAHEINQPLASIVSNASASLRWLNRPEPVVAQAMAGLSDIVNDSKRAAEIVRALQSLARQAPPQHQALQIDDVIRQVVTLTATEIEQHHVQLYKTLNGPNLGVKGDAVQLQQVILNLIMNAVEAMGSVTDKPRRLSISCDTVAEQYVVVCVHDNGAGIDEQHAARVFDAFFTTKEKGMGMGLAICRSIVDAHGGTLRACNARSGGAMFVFTLPVVAALER